MPNTITIDGQRFALTPIDEPQAKYERELGEIERGEQYHYVNSDGSVGRYNDQSDDTDNAFAACGNYYHMREAAEQAAAREALTRRALRVRDEIRGEWRDGYGVDARYPCIAAGNTVGCSDWLHVFNPWGFASRADLERFIDALGADNVRQLLTLDTQPNEA